MRLRARFRAFLPCLQNLQLRAFLKARVFGLSRLLREDLRQGSLPEAVLPKVRSVHCSSLSRHRRRGRLLLEAWLRSAFPLIRKGRQLHFPFYFLSGLSFTSLCTLLHSSPLLSPSLFGLCAIAMERTPSPRRPVGAARRSAVSVSALFSSFDLFSLRSLRSPAPSCRPRGPASRAWPGTSTPEPRKNGSLALRALLPPPKPPSLLSFRLRYGPT